MKAPKMLVKLKWRQKTQQTAAKATLEMKASTCLLLAVVDKPNLFRSAILVSALPFTNK